MADKQVKVKLIADVQNYVKGMRDAADATEGVERSAGNVKDWGGEWGAAASLVGGQMLAMGAATAVGIGLAVNSYANFDQAMSGVAAATHASAADMELLTTAARDAGKTTAFSATEAASAIEALSKAGVSTQDILGGGLKGALDLAAAGSLDVGQAAEIAATAMTQFKLSGDQIPHVADLLAAGAGKAQGEVSDLGAALQQGGLVASQFGLSIEETVGGLSAFASAGMIGSDAGTSFKTMIQRLSNPTGEASAKLKELGISAFDAQGNFVGLATFAGQLQTSMAVLTPEARNAAMSIIFGADAVRGANVLYEQGQAGIQGWIDKVNDAGFASETALLKQDNLRGDLEKLGGAWDDLMIGFGESANGSLRSVVQVLIGFADAIGSLPPYVQTLVTGVGGLASAALLGVGGFLVLIPKLAETRAAMDTLGITTSGLSSKLRTAGIAFAAVWLAVEVGKLALDAVTSSAEEAASAIKNAGSATDILTAAMSRSTSIGEVFGWRNDAAEAADLVANLTDRIRETQGAWYETGSQARDDIGTFKLLGETLADMDPAAAAAGFKEFAEALPDEQLVQLMDLMPAYRDALNEQAAGTGLVNGALDTYDEKLALAKAAINGTLGSGDQLTEGLSQQESAAQKTAEAIGNLADEIRGYDDVMTGMMNSEVGFYQSLDDLNQALTENGATLDLNTQAGRDNQSALADLVSSTNDYAASIIEAKGSSAEANAVIQQGREAYVQMAVAMGTNADVAQQYADKLFMIPDEVTTKVEASTEDAKLGIEDVAQQLLNLQGPGNPALVIHALTDDAKAKLSELGIELTQLADGTWTAKLSADPTQAEQQTAALVALINASAGTVGVGGEDRGAGWMKDSIISGINSSSGRVGIGATDNASWVIAGVRNSLANLPTSKTITITAQAVGNAMGAFLSGNADGGLYAYANGGFGSMAFPFGSLPTGIYPGGQPIYKFAEPETGWEAFVSGKRGQEYRNLAILDDARMRLLSQLGRAREFADGGVAAYARVAEQQSYSSSSVINNGIPAGSTLVLEVAGQQIAGVVRAVAGPVADRAASSAVRSYDSDRSRTARHGRERGR